MIAEDDTGRPAKPAGTGPAPLKRDLTALSVGELNGYIAELQAEIARVEADIRAKERQRSSAEALFRR